MGYHLGKLSIIGFPDDGDPVSVPSEASTWRGGGGGGIT